MRKLELSIQGMSGVESETKILNKLKTVDGVLLVHIDTVKGCGVITFDASKVQAFEIAKAIESIGYTVKAKVVQGIKSGDSVMSTGELVFRVVFMLVLVALAGFMYLPMLKVFE